jgi:hypothetical protein
MLKRRLYVLQSLLVEENEVMDVIRELLETIELLPG